MRVIPIVGRSLKEIRGRSYLPSSLRKFIKKSITAETVEIRIEFEPKNRDCRENAIRVVLLKRDEDGFLKIQDIGEDICSPEIAKGLFNLIIS